MEKTNKKKKGLSPRQEIFAQKLAECGVASEAYRAAFPGSLKWKDSAVWSKSSTLSKRPEIVERVNQLKKELREKSEVSKKEILDLCRDIIRGKQIVDHKIETPKGNRVVGMSRSWAVERVCKLLGLDAPEKQEITGKDGEPLAMPQMTSEELAIFMRLNGKK